MAFDVDYFLSFRRFTGNWRQHNQALKWLRSIAENPANPHGSERVAIQQEELIAVPPLVPHRKGDGPHWEFDHSVEPVPWDWKEFVAQLRDNDIITLVGQSPLVRCELAVRPNSYDHLRQQLVSDQQRTFDPNVKLPVWDFVLHRQDGSAVRLHPQRTHTDVSWFDSQCHQETVPPPRSGLGRSDGPGTVRRYKQEGVQGKFKFDANKNPQLRGKGVGKHPPPPPPPPPLPDRPPGLEEEGRDRSTHEGEGIPFLSDLD